MGQTEIFFMTNSYFLWNEFKVLFFYILLQWVLSSLSFIHWFSPYRISQKNRKQGRNIWGVGSEVLWLFFSQAWWRLRVFQERPNAETIWDGSIFSRNWSTEPAGWYRFWRPHHSQDSLVLQDFKLLNVSLSILKKMYLL